jgi:signal transduction histidine kinase
MRWGLRLRVLVVLASMLSLTTLMNSLTVLGLTRRSMELQHEQTLEDLAGLTATTMSAAMDPTLEIDEGVNREDLMRLSELVVRQFPGTIVVVTDAGGEPFGMWPGGVGRSPAGRSSAELALARADPTLLARGVSSTPVVVSDRAEATSSDLLVVGGRVVGTVSLTRPFSGVRMAMIVSQQLAVLYIVLSGGLMLIVGFFFLTRVLVRPLDALVTATERVAGGDLRSDVDVHGTGEFKDLQQSFNKMVARLRDGRAALEERLNELTESNRRLEHAQMESVRAERLATIGQMAAGLAHEVGNPLSAVMGLLEVVDEDLTPPERADLVGRIQGEVRRIDRILRELLDYARTGTGRRQLVAAIDPVRQAIRLLSHHARGRAVEVRLDSDPVVAVVSVDPDALVQVVLNLLVNAADAMKGRGVVDVSLHEYGGELHIAVRDHGPGIAPEVMGRLFTPFFTTKDPGTGTGLGLSVSERLVSQAGGYIRVESFTDGSCFTVCLPCVPSGALEAEQERSQE